MSEQMLNSEQMLKEAEQRLATGDRNGAAKLFLSVLQADSGNVIALTQLSSLHLQSGRHNEARALVARALGQDLRVPAYAMHLGRALVSIGDSSTFLELVSQLPPSMWDSAMSLGVVAQQLVLVGANDLADPFVDEALRREPRNPQALHLKATLDVFFGRLDAASEHAQACLATEPHTAGAHWLLSRLRLPNAQQRVANIRSILAEASVSDEDRVWLWYAIHNELHDAKDWEGAWEALSQACHIKRTLLRHDADATRAMLAALRGTTREELRETDGWIDPTLSPIFIVGMHRSGTTLMERIVSGHSTARAGGETYDFTTALRRECGLHFRGTLHEHAVVCRSRFRFEQIGRRYCDAIRWRAAGHSRVTDKLPSNYLNIGLIARALPSAKIIHMRRDPMDVGFSNLRTLFADAAPYSYDQADFVAYYREYERLMAHWREVLPEGRMLDVEYQRLVDNPEAEAMRVCDFLEIPFEPAMLDIGSRTDAVATASSVMMRDGIRKDRGAVWRPYASYLGPLMEAFGSA